MNDYHTELENRDKKKKPIRITGTEEISCRCPNDNYEVGWGVPDEELDLMYSFCPECGQRMDWEGVSNEKDGN